MKAPSAAMVKKTADWLFLKISDSTTPEMRKLYREKLAFLAKHGHLLGDDWGQQ